MNIQNANSPQPVAEQAERAVISVILRHPETHLSRARGEGLTPSMLHNPACSKLLQTIYALADDEKAIDEATLVDYLQNAGELDRVGGGAGIMDIAGAAPNTQHFDQHMQLVRDRHTQRFVISGSSKIEEAAHDSPESALRVLREIAEAAALVGSSKKCFQNFKESFEKFRSRVEETKRGLAPIQPTGIKELDAINGGMRPGELWIASGPTSSGKSALAYQMAIPALDAGKKVLIFTLEMTSDEVIARLISCRGGIDLGAIMNSEGMDGQLMKKLSLQVSGMRDSKLLISDEPSMSIDYVCAQSEMEAELGDVGLVVVDYIQLLDGGRKSGDTQEMELALYSRRLKQLAKKLNCPVISPAQLNDDGRLRGSRAIGMDADVLLKITPEGVVVDKYRNGARDQVLPLGLLGKYQRFVTMDFKPQNQYRR